MVALQLRGVHPVKVVGAEILKRQGVAEHVVADDEDAVGVASARFASLGTGARPTLQTKQMWTARTSAGSKSVSETLPSGIYCDSLAPSTSPCRNSSRD